MSTAAWREANREKIKAAAATKYESNPDQAKARSAMYRAANPEKVKALQSKYVGKYTEKQADGNKLRRSALSDGYVASKLFVPLVDCTPDLIEMKREQLLMHRALRELNKILKEQNGN